MGFQLLCRVSPWQGSAWTQSALIFFPLSFGRVGERIFSFFICSQHVPFKFPMDSHQVLNIFRQSPMCSSNVFPIAPHFNPICFAQSPPLLTYIGGPKGETLHLSLESPILGSPHTFNFFLEMGQSNWLIAKKTKLALSRTTN